MRRSAVCSASGATSAAKVTNLSEREETWGEGARRDRYTHTTARGESVGREGERGREGGRKRGERGEAGERGKR